MKTLSIKQPWTWLILHAGKDIENRTWYTRVRGTILIQAGKTADPPKPAWADYGVPLDAPMGGIVGSVDLVDCVSRSNSPWFHGPYGFVLCNPRPVKFMPYRGQLGFFDVQWSDHDHPQ